MTIPELTQEPASPTTTPSADVTQARTAGRRGGQSQQRDTGKEAVQRLLAGGFTAATQSIVPEDAQRLADEELMREIQFLASIIPALPRTDPIREAAISNFHILVNEALSRGVSPAAPGLEFASPEKVEALEGRIELLIVLLERLLPEFNEPGGAVKVKVDRLRERQIQLSYLLAEEVDSESARLDGALASLEIVVRAWRSVPHKDPGNPELRDALMNVVFAIAQAVLKLATDEEHDAITKLGEAGTAYVDTMTRVLLGAAAEARKSLKDPASVHIADYGYFTEGFSRDWPRLTDEWGRYVGALFGLQGELRGLGDVARMQFAPLDQRIALVGEIGGRIVDALQRSRAITLIEGAFYLGGKLLDEVVEEWQQRFSDISIAFNLKLIIDDLLKALEANEPPSEEVLTSAWDSIQQAQSRVKARLEELAEYKAKVEWMATIVATIVGIEAFQLVGTWLRGVAVLRTMAGGAAIRFVLSSLAFTTATTVTRGALTGKWPTPTEFGKQAAFDIATLGLLRGVQGLVGLAYAGRTVPTWVAHGATFTTLWAWSSTWALIESDEPVTFESAIKTIAHTGVRTAIDLAVITTVHKYVTMPPLEGVDVSTSVGRTIQAEWNALRVRAQGIGRELETWRRSAERDPAEFDRILRRAETILGDARGIFDRLGEAGYLTERDVSEISRQVDQHIDVLRNMSQAGRLGIQPNGEFSYTYTGDPAGLDLYLRRLVRQGLIQSFERITDRGIFEVRYPGGELGYFEPTRSQQALVRQGRGVVRAPDFAAEELARAAPDVPKPIRAFALQNLRRLPPPQTNEVVLALDRAEGPDVVKWLARPDVGAALAAPQPVFDADMITRMTRDAAARGQLAPEIATSIQAWNEAWRERVGPGKSATEFLDFLREMKSFHGTLDVGSTAEARRVLANFSRRAEATPWALITGPKPAAIGPAPSPTELVSREPTPYAGIDDYLAKQGVRPGEFIKAKFDEGTWIVRFEAGAPARGWRFPRSGYPPDREIDISALTGLLKTGVANAETQAKVEPEAARRTMERLRPVYDQLNFLARITGASFGDVPDLINRFEGFAREQAIRDWETLRTAERPYTGKFGRDEFIQRYVEQGLEFDVETRDWRSAAQQPVAKVRFSPTATPTEALDILLGKATPPVSFGQAATPDVPTFKPYYDLLVNEKIATRAQIVSELARIDPRGKTVDNVRHRLKEAYRPWVVDRMVKPNAAQMRARYGDLDRIWEDNPAEALRRASHREMLRLTDPLAPADKGSLGEEWYKLVHRPAAVPHIPITQADVPKGTVELLQERAADFVEGDALREVKRVSGALEQRDLDQFKDFMAVLELPNGIELEVRGARVRVTRGVYVFEVPQGVKANADWMYRQLSRPRRLSFEIFNRGGEMKTITYENRAELLEPALSQWLGLPTAPP